MHLNYHFFKHLAGPLQQKLKGKKLLTSFSQEKDELVLGFGNADGDCYLRVSVLTSFSGLYLTDDFKRARKNSADLFPGFTDLEIEDVQLFENERAIELKLEKKHSLILKMFGNRSNVLGVIDQKVVTVFNNRLSQDKELNPATLHRKIDQSQEAFIHNGCSPQNLFPTWGKIPMQLYESQKNGNCEDDWELCQTIGQELNKGHFYLTQINEKLHLSLLNVGKVIEVFDDPIAANNRFFIENLKAVQLNSEQSQVIKQLQKRIEQTRSYLKQTEDTLNKLIEGAGNQQIGHLIMANLYQIPENTEQVVLPDFESGTPVTVKLKKTLSPQKNAEAYYRKAKNEKVQFDFLEQNIEQKQRLLEDLENQLLEASSVASLKELRGFVKAEMPKENKKQTQRPEDLFKVFEKGAYKIWVGRNAKNNDLLTLKYADKNDTWLHARDVAGSHVVIKQIPGTKIPKDVLEYAAQLAAWYSKRKTDSLVPVVYTQKKYVRKIKGSPDGQVIVDQEDVLLIKPEPMG